MNKDEAFIQFLDVCEITQQGILMEAIGEREVEGRVKDSVVSFYDSACCTLIEEYFYDIGFDKDVAAFIAKAVIMYMRSEE